MQVKVFELRDRATFIPIIVTKIPAMGVGENEDVQYLLGRAGYRTNTSIILTNLSYPEQSHADVYDWGCRTYSNAHRYIEENFDDLVDGQVIDVEYILGETKEPKLSERITNKY